MPKTVLVTGATGFVGSHLAQALTDAGHEVRAMTRHPDGYDGPGKAIGADVDDRDQPRRQAMQGVDVAYYLVHSLDSKNFEEKDAAAARNFGGAAAAAGRRAHRLPRRAGPRGRGHLSAHLRSRRQVEKLLPEAGVPVTALRAAVVIGHGGISWEITRQLIDHLPVMITPKWVKTRTQPIALPDVIRYLVGVLEPDEARGRVFEIGGPEVLRYIDMLQGACRKSAGQDAAPRSRCRCSARSCRRTGSRWSRTSTTRRLSNLVESMTNEVVVHDRSIEQLSSRRATIGYDESVRLALADRAKASCGTIERTMTHPTKLPRTDAGHALQARVQRVVEQSLIDPVPRDHQQPDSEFRRRRIVVAISLVIGTVLLGLSLATAPGDCRVLPVDDRGRRGLDHRRFRVRPVAPRLHPVPRLAAPPARPRRLRARAASRRRCSSIGALDRAPDRAVAMPSSIMCCSTPTRATWR